MLGVTGCCCACRGKKMASVVCVILKLSVWLLFSSVDVIRWSLV